MYVCEVVREMLHEVLFILSVAHVPLKCVLVAVLVTVQLLKLSGPMYSSVILCMLIVSRTAWQILYTLLVYSAAFMKIVVVGTVYCFWIS